MVIPSPSHSFLMVEIENLICNVCVNVVTVPKEMILEMRILA